MASGCHYHRISLTALLAVCQRVCAYLAKVSHVKKVKGVEQVAFLHPEFVAARRQESPDVLQAQELCGEDSKDAAETEAPINTQGASQARMMWPIIILYSVLLAFTVTV